MKGTTRKTNIEVTGHSQSRGMNQTVVETRKIEVEYSLERELSHELVYKQRGAHIES